MTNPSPSNTPPSNQALQVIRFSFDKSQSEFISDFYTEGMTNGKASAIEIKNVLLELRNLQRATYLKQNIVMYLSHAWILLIIVFSVLKIGDIQLDRLKFNFLVLVSLCLTFWSILRCMDLFIWMLDEKRSSRRRAVAEKHNQDFSARELKWHAPIHSPGLVELWKHYEIASNPQDGGSMTDNPSTLAPESPLIFYLDECSQKFDSSFYSPILTGGRVSHGELNDMLANIELCRKPIASRAKLMGTGRLICCILMSCFWPILLWNSSELSEFHLNGLTCVFFALGAMVWGFIEKRRQLDEQWKSECRARVGRHSQKLASRGLRWDISADATLYIVLQKAKVIESSSPCQHRDRHESPTRRPSK